MTLYIYVLLLEENKFYVGRTENLQKRIEDHKNSNGCAWTSKYKYIKIIETFIGDLYDEIKTTYKYMDVYGINNVRGAQYCSINLSFEQHLNIYKELNNLNNKCLACGKPGHFIQECKEDICYRCGHTGHIVSNCFAKIHKFNGKLDGCYRCGRDSHWKIRCNRSKDVFGRKLESNCIIM